VTAVDQARRADLRYVHRGSFSGIAGYLRTALEPRASLFTYDLLPLARRPALLPQRLRAMVEARREGRGIPWTKTAAWSAAVQRRASADGALAGGPVLFVQTWPAFVTDGGLRYSIYTDRVARDGAAGAQAHASRFTPQWSERETRFVRGAERVYLMGPHCREVLERSYGVAPERIAVLGGGPNMALGPPVASERCRRLLFVGVDWHRKGGPELLDAFARVRVDFPDLELTLVGSGPDHPVPAGVRALGRVPHAGMDAVYSEADLFVLPTHHEAFGVVLIEAITKALPCVHTTVGSQRWIVGDAGEAVEPGDVDSLATAIRAVVADYPSYKRRADRRAEEARQSLRWEAVADVIVRDMVPA